jgi:hypothetical protein
MLNNSHVTTPPTISQRKVFPEYLSPNAHKYLAETPISDIDERVFWQFIQDAIAADDLNAFLLLI